jgi:methionyl-tRNA synthetase
MFDVSRIKEKIEAALKNTNKLIHPEYYQDLMLKDLSEIDEISVSRPTSRITWGIEVPNDPNFSIYVWLDALVNYLTVIDYPRSDPSQFEFIHVIGKDIVKFHSIYWIAFLTALGLAPPHKLLVHNHWLYEKVFCLKIVLHVGMMLIYFFRFFFLIEKNVQKLG